MTTELTKEGSSKSPLVISSELWIGRQDELIQKYGGRENYTRLIRETLLSQNLRIGKDFDRKPLKPKEVSRYLADITRYYLETLQGGEHWTAKSYAEGFNLAFNSPQPAVRAAALRCTSSLLHLGQWKTESLGHVWSSHGEKKTELIYGTFTKVSDLAQNDNEEVRIEAVNLLGSLVQLGINQHRSLIGGAKVGVGETEQFSKSASQVFKQMLDTERSPQVMKALVSNCLELYIDENSGGAKNLKKDWEFTQESLPSFLDEYRYSIESLELIADILSSKYMGHRHLQFKEPFTVRKMQEICESTGLSETSFSKKVHKRAAELFKGLRQNEDILPELMNEISHLLFI